MLERAFTEETVSRTIQISKVEAHVKDAEHFGYPPTRKPYGLQFNNVSRPMCCEKD
jgi:hypothetical protein